MSRLDRAISFANLVLLLWIAGLVVVQGGLPVRLSPTQRAVLAPMVCEHGIQAIIGTVEPANDPCHRRIDRAPLEPKRS